MTIHLSQEGDDRFQMRFDERLWFALHRSGLGVQEMADRLDVSRNAVSTWINGRNRPRPRDLKAFALATGYPVDWLRDGECTPRDLNPEPTDSGTWLAEIHSLESALSIRQKVTA